VGCIPSNFDKEDDYKPWTKMWNGITFPIRDQNGRMISISRRLIKKEEGRPKYDHYPFNARRVLFGLYQNKNEIRQLDRAIITEGQLDVISSWQHGLKIVTSSFGAHGSLDHLAVLSRYASIVDILYDEDNAGKVGTDAIEQFETYGDLEVNLRTGIFPQGDDLDSWIRTHSMEELFTLINKTKVDHLRNKLRFLKSK
jgi:DNA primase